jgi:hypothetical protein
LSELLEVNPAIVRPRPVDVNPKPALLVRRDDDFRAVDLVDEPSREVFLNDPPVLVVPMRLVPDNREPEVRPRPVLPMAPLASFLVEGVLLELDKLPPSPLLPSPEIIQKCFKIDNDLRTVCH